MNSLQLENTRTMLKIREESSEAKSSFLATMSHEIPHSNERNARDGEPPLGHRGVLTVRAR